MMAEMPPGGGSNVAGGMPPGGSMSDAVAPPTRQGIALHRTYVFSIVGILTAVATVLAFVSMICVEAGKVSGITFDFIAFHEFTSITSWLTLMVFVVVASLQLYQAISIRPAVMKFVMLGHSATWALLTLISSSVLLDGLFTTDGLRAAGAFGLLESFALMGVTTLLVLDLLNVYRQNVFE